MIDFTIILMKVQRTLTKSCEMKQKTANFECGAMQKRANPVDLEKCCKIGVKKIGFYTVENGTSNVRFTTIP